MKLHKAYCAFLVADLDASEDWYTRFLGRPPDNRPIDSLVQWELFDHVGLAISTSTEIAGAGVAFLIVQDVGAERRRLAELGIDLGTDIPGDYSTLAQIRDPDGNLITLATPPDPAYPAA